ncbi:hypothetical protein B0H14DRAFT_3528743 [Mycena olivaceomarginata]|nr:hypothetical protein B0H14DRAFT_3528743 [Mycena olivaceomarginata]
MKMTQTLTPGQVQILQQADSAAEAERRAGMTTGGTTGAPSSARPGANSRRARDVDVPDFFQEDNILHGYTTLDISHAREAIPEDEADQDDVDLLHELREHHNQIFAGRGRRQRDRRAQRNRTQIMVDVFAAQLDKMTDAYMDWSLAMADKGLGGSYTQPEDSVEEDQHPVGWWIYSVSRLDYRARFAVLILVICCGFCSAYIQAVPIIAGDVFIASAFVRNGLMPCSPHEPSVVVTVCVLEVFRVLQLCCPRLGMQALSGGSATCTALHLDHTWAKFSIAYDVYLSIRAEVDKHVKATLGRDTPNWRLKNACPACMYKLEGESPLKLPLITTQDGNNSMKRFLASRARRGISRRHYCDSCASKERKENRVAPAVVIGNKYRRALKIKAGLPALQDTMRSLNVESREVFETWLAKEKQYLRSLSKEPLEETLEMEYSRSW